MQITCDGFDIFETCERLQWLNGIKCFFGWPYLIYLFACDFAPHPSSYFHQSLCLSIVISCAKEGSQSSAFVCLVVKHMCGFVIFVPKLCFLCLLYGKKSFCFDLIWFYLIWLKSNKLQIAWPCKPNVDTCNHSLVWQTKRKKTLLSPFTKCTIYFRCIAAAWSFFIVSMKEIAGRGRCLVFYVVWPLCFDVWFYTKT